MNLLELFSGTGSVGKIAKTLGYNVISLDLKNADIKTNILDWDFTIYPQGHFDVIWASPPCNTFSILRCSLIGRSLTRSQIESDIVNTGLPILRKTQEIIDYYKPKNYFIENPQTGRMKDYLDLPFYDVDYCRYCDWGYKKRTRIWTDICEFEPLKCNKKCAGFTDNKHPTRIGVRGKTTLKERYRIPPDLIKSLFGKIKN